MVSRLFVLVERGNSAEKGPFEAARGPSVTEKGA